MTNLDIWRLNCVLQARGGGSVQRCHTVRHAGSYSNAEHSWGVAMLLLQLYPEHSRRLLAVALVHDIPEAVTGDVPATVKHGSGDDHEFDDHILAAWDLPTLGSLNADEKLVLKTCDKLELWLWAREQLSMGNNFSIEVVENLEFWFSKEGYLDSRGHAFWQLVKQHPLGPIPMRVGQYAAFKESFDEYCASRR
jgi:hypothetical protein